MTSPDIITLGLAPALTVEEVTRFGPLTLSPVGQSDDDDLRDVAARYALERSAHSEFQALVSCPRTLRPLVPTIWSLFVFACVTYARRREHQPRGVLFPENFHILSITRSQHGLIFDTGQSLGFGDVQHLPLRWPVDRPATLHDGSWDRRIELACALLARDPGTSSNNAVAVAAGMAADLACAAMERHNQRIQNVATGARTYVLLGSALEALHCRGSGARHSHTDVIKGVARMDTASTSLGELVFSRKGLRRPPRPEPGTEATRPMFAVAQLVHLRNTYAHGRVPAESDYTLPAELNKCHPMHAATLILAKLIGDDLSRELNCVVPSGTREMTAARDQLGLPFELVHAALIDGHELLRCLSEAIIPTGGSPDPGPEAAGSQ